LLHLKDTTVVIATNNEEFVKSCSRVIQLTSKHNSV